MKKVTQLSEPILVNRQLPLNIIDDHQSGFLNEKTRLIPSCFLFNFSNVNILSDGTIFNYFLPYKESFVSELPNHRLHNYKGLIKLYFTWPIKRFDKKKKYLLVHDAWSNGYYHWMTDFLPRLYLAQNTLKDFTLLIPKKYSEPFQRETLNLFDIKNIEYLEEHTIYKIESLYFVSHIAHMGNYHPVVLRGLTDYIAKKLNITTMHDFGDKIYISRKNALRRKIINDSEIEEYLTTIGFRVVTLENYTYSEQVEICSKCKYMISIHGAGLTNMMFMNPNSSVLELKKFDNNENYFFYTLANALNLKYYYQYCNSEDINSSVQDADIYVNMDELKRNITQLLNG